MQLRSGRIVKPFVRKKKARPTLAPLVRRVKKLERKTSAIESKFSDLTLATLIIPSALNIMQPAHLIQQGDQASQRNGDSITLVSIQARLMLSTNTAGDNNIVRFLIVQDKQCNGVIFTAAELFLDATVDDILTSPYNLDNKHRFRVLHDSVISVNDAGHANHIWKVFKKLNMKIRYDATAGAITDITSNNIYVCFVGNSLVLGDVQGIVRLRYLDG